MESELKGAEKELVVRGSADLLQQKLRYIGRKTIAKYGCFGCHDIPGFEDAKPIGTGLADWGRKDPAKLAFEHITHYIGGHGTPHSTKAAAHPTKADASSEGLYADTKAISAQADPTTAVPAATLEVKIASNVTHATEERADYKSFYTHALEAGNRIGFIYQK